MQEIALLNIFGFLKLSIIFTNVSFISSKRYSLFEMDFYKILEYTYCVIHS